MKWLREASRALEEPPQITANQRKLSQANSKVLSTASSIGLVLLYIYIYIDLLVRRRTNQLRAVERGGFEPGCFEEARSFFDWFFDSFLEHLAPEAVGAAISRLQRLWGRPSRGARGSGSSYLEALEALRAAVSRLWRLREQPS